MTCRFFGRIRACRLVGRFGLGPLKVPYRVGLCVIWLALRCEGFAVPRRRYPQEALTAGLEPVVAGRWAPCGFAHLLNLLWSPNLEYMDACTDDAAPEPKWSTHLALNHAALLAEIGGCVNNASAPLDMDDWIDFIQQTLRRLLEVNVPTRLIMKVMSRIVFFLC